MGNILFALDTTNPDMNALDFACYLSKCTRWKLRVVSVKNEQATIVPVITLWPSRKITVNGLPSNAPYHATLDAPHNHNSQCLFDACQNRGVNAQVDCNEETGFFNLVAQTRFADLLIIGASTSVRDHIPDCLSGFVKSLLRQAECPVMIPPANFESIDRIVFAYNGSKSSVFAIKQFTYLFPQFTDRPVTVLEINKHYDMKIAERSHMLDWLQQRYRTVDFEQWQGSAPYALFRYFLGKENLLLVMGSFGRSALSEALKPSAATKVLKYVNVPVFITHH